VRCTFEDTQRGKIIVEKQTFPDGATQEFEFDANYYEANFTLSDGESNDSGDLEPGSYSVAEVNIPDDWDLTNAYCDDDSDPASISLEAGETVHCYFENTQRGKIIVEKQTDPDGANQQFEFEPSWGPNFFLMDDQQNDSGWLPSNASYSVAEVNVPAGWQLTDYTCDDGSDPSSIYLDPGETVTCVFENAGRGDLEVTKYIDWGPGEPDPTVAFTICIQGPSYPDGDCQTIGFEGGTLYWTDLVPGEYLVSEVDPGWRWTVTINPSTAAVAPGEEAQVDVYNEWNYWAFTPGFWKNHYNSPSEHDAWQFTAYYPPDDYPLFLVFASADLVLDDSFADTNLWTALFDLQGGVGLEGAGEILFRAAIASLLNASFHELGGHDIGPTGVFPYTSAEVIQMVNDAVAESVAYQDRQPMLDLAYELDQINNGIEYINWDDPYSLP
jgi:hypothetical protein